MTSKFLRKWHDLLVLGPVRAQQDMRRTDPSEWREISDLIHMAHKKKKILCPRSVEHFIESFAMPAGQARRANDKLRKLGFHWIMRDELQITCRQILSAARGRRMNRGDYIFKTTLREEAEESRARGMCDFKDETFDTIQNPIDFVNKIRDAARGGKRGTVESDEIVLNHIKSIYVDALLLQFRRIADGKRGSSVVCVGMVMRQKAWDRDRGPPNGSR